MTGMETKEMKSLKGENDEQRIETWKAVMAWNNSGTARGKVLSNWENAMTGMETKEMKSLKGENDEQRIEPL